jgi:toxin ParE1/3/4
VGEARLVRVRYTRTALRQIDAAVGYLKAENPQAARGLQERILGILAQLQTHPHSARRTSRPNIRRVPLGTYPYLLDYSADESEIVVRRFRHAARRPLT